ncbi:MAG TPA: hypothetical protein PLB45_04575 [Bacilli bacterium]|jgi:hypothetical protein|nr:hypothetical protein [Bacilli bacterium]HQC84128.1 hypothetical protein [Bacilli bacterium]
MKQHKQLELIMDDDGFPRIGYHICNVFFIKDNNQGETFDYNFNTIQLYGFGYCPKTQDFYYNKNIKLPNRIVKYFDGCTYSKENIELLKSIGVVDYYDENMVALKQQFHDYQANEIKQEVESFKIKQRKQLLKLDEKY